jgi:hypothetical protein
MPNRDNNVLEAKENYFWTFIWIAGFHTLVFSRVKYVHVCKISYSPKLWRVAKKLFSAKGYVEIQIQRPIFANEKGIESNIIFKIQMVRTWSLGSPTYRIFS